MAEMIAVQLEEGEEFLAHHGILGMRWGHRSADSDREEGSSKSRDTTGIYNARKNVAERQAALKGHKANAGDSVYSSNKVKQLKADAKTNKKEYKAEAKVAAKSATKKEAVVKGLAIAGISSYVGAKVLDVVATEAPSAKIKAGASIASHVLNGAALGLSIGAIGTGISTGRDERKYHNANS